MISQLTEIGDRLNQYLLLKKIGLHMLAREAGISASLITNMLVGGSYDFIFFVKLANRLTDLNINWVLTGDGEMLLLNACEDLPPASRPGQSPQAVRTELKLLSVQKENVRLKKQLEEKNEAIKLLKETLGPVQTILMDID